MGLQIGWAGDGGCGMGLEGSPSRNVTRWQCHGTITLVKESEGIWLKQK